MERTVLCPTCGSDDQEEIDGVYYCLVCNTQMTGITAQSADEFIDVPRELMREITVKKVRKSRAKADTGEAWTTFEAFNIILIKQVTFLTEIYEGVDMKLKEIVLGLWTAYLEKTEAGFMDGSDSPPHLSTNSRKRDKALLAAGLDKVPMPKYASHRERGNTQCKRIRAGSKVLVNIEQDIDYGPMEGFECPSRRIPTQSQHTYFGQSQRDAIVRKFFAPEVRDSSDEEEEAVAIVRMKDRETESDDDDEETEIETFDPVEYKIPKKKLNKISRHLQRSLGEDYFKGTKKMTAGNPHFIDLMAMSKTIAFINIALRIMDEDIFTIHLINWVDLGHFPYFSGTRMLPEKWRFTNEDAMTFHVSASPTPTNINRNSNELLRLLDIPPLPPINMIKLIGRLLDDLNLPQDILKFISSDPLLLYKVEKLGRYYKNPISYIPFFEQRAVCVILVIMRKLFALDGIKSKKYSQMVQECENDDAFVYDQWEAYTRLRLQMISNYFMPLFKVDSGKMKDVQVITDFQQTIANKWRPRNILCGDKTMRSRSEDDDFRIDLAQIILEKAPNKEDTDETECKTKKRDDRKFTQFPKPSLYFLNDATEFAIRRIDDEDLCIKLKQDFRRKSLSHIQEGSIYMMNYEELCTLSYKEFLRTHFKSFSESLQLIITLIGIMIRSTSIRGDIDLFVELKKIEKILFPCHKAKQTRPKRSKPRTN